MVAHVGQRAAAPLVRLLHEAAGRVLRAAGFVVAHVLGVSCWTRNGLAELRLQGRDLLPPRQADAARLVTRLLGHVAGVAFRAAVLMIFTANSLQTKTDWFLKAT